MSAILPVVLAAASVAASPATPRNPRMPRAPSIRIPVLEDVGRPGGWRALRFVAGHPALAERVCIASARRVHCREQDGSWRTVLTMPLGSDDVAGPPRTRWLRRPLGMRATASGSESRRITALARVRRGVVVGLSRGAYLVRQRSWGWQRHRLPLGQLPVRVAVAAGASVWIAQGVWLWRSRDDGDTFRRVGRSPGGRWRFLAVSPRGAALLGGDGRALYASRDGGATWNEQPVPDVLGRPVFATFARGDKGAKPSGARPSGWVAGPRGVAAIGAPGGLQWPIAGGERPRFLLAERRGRRAVWVLAQRLWRFGRDGRWPVVLGLRGEAIRAIATDTERPGGLWALTPTTLRRMRWISLRRGGALRCPRDPGGGASVVVPRLGHWWYRRFVPQLVVRIAGSHSSSVDWRRSRFSPEQLAWRRPGAWSVWVSLSWPLDGRVWAARVAEARREIAAARRVRRRRRLRRLQTECWRRVLAPRGEWR